MQIDFKINGIEELETALDKLSSLHLEAIRKKQVTQMLNRARQPGGTPVDTGDLRQSSMTSEYEMGYTAEYAAHVEYGHRTRNGGYVQGRHYLQANVDAQREIYKQDLINWIKEVGG